MKRALIPNCSSGKAAHLAKGAWAEQLARDWLQHRGLCHIESNYQVRHGEIDLVMLDGEALVFVEVRYRSDNKWIDPLATLLPHKQQKLMHAADTYLQTHQRFAGKICRFDVVAVRGPQTKPELEWVKDAFNCQ